MNTSNNSMNPTDEHNLISKILQGEKELFGELVNKYQDMVYTICIRILPIREEAEEVAQDAFVKAYTKLGSFKFQSKFSTWLYTITYRLAISKKRSSHHIPLSQTLEEIKNEDENLKIDWPFDLEEQDKTTYIKKALGMMNENESLALTLYYLDSNNIKEVAEIMDRKDSSVKVLLFRGRKNMMNLLNKMLKGELNSVL